LDKHFGSFLKELAHTLHSPDGKHKIIVDNLTLILEVLSDIITLDGSLSGGVAQFIRRRGSMVTGMMALLNRNIQLARAL